jgi:hypothetical protein
LSLTTTFRLPGSAREVPWNDGSGSWSNVNNALLADGSYAVCTLPNGATYSPTSGETTAGKLLGSRIFLYNFNFASELPANATVTGISVKFVLLSQYTGLEQNVNYYIQFADMPDAVIAVDDGYYLFEPAVEGAPLGDTSIKISDGPGSPVAPTVWQPSKNLSIDGMFLVSTDGNAHGYEVMTSTLDSFAYDFFYNGHDLLIQPTTAGYQTAIMDAASVVDTMDYSGLVGKTITFTVPGVGDFTLTGQAGAVSSGDATFQAAVDNETTQASISNQFLNYSNVNGAVADYVSITYFRDIIWQWTPNDTGAATNLYRLTTNADPAILTWPNDGYFSGGSDPDPNASTMASSTGVDKINNESGAPILARSDYSQNVFGLEITNTLSNLSLKTSIPASVFRSTTFGLVFYYDPIDSDTGDPLVYPTLVDNTQKLDYAKVQLTYTVPTGGGYTTLLMGGK